MLLRNLWPLSLLMPWMLPDLAGTMLDKAALPLKLPVLMTGLWVVLFVGVAVWRFERLEL
jgi:hypothetical protein